MRKLLAAILSVVMLMSAVGSAAGVNVHVGVNYSGQNMADVTAGFFEDNDGCYQLSVDGTAMGQALDFFVQVGKSAAVIASGGQAYEIEYAKLAEAAINVLPNYLSDEAKTALTVIAALVYYAANGGLEADMPVFQQVLSSVLNTVMAYAMQSGILTVSQNGDIIVAFDQDKLASFLTAVIGAIASDGTICATLATTQLWQMAGLSADGAAEQEMLKQLASGVSVDFGEVEFDVYLAIYSSGNIDFSADVAFEDGTANVSAAYDANGLKANGTLQVDEVLLTCALTYDASGMSFTAVGTEDGQQMLSVVFTADASGLELNMQAAGTVISASLKTENNLITSTYSITQNGAVVYAYTYVIDTRTGSITLSGSIAQYGNTMYFTASYTQKDGLQFTVTDGETSLAGSLIVRANPSGFRLIGKASVTGTGFAYDIADIDINIGARITIKAAVNVPNGAQYRPLFDLDFALDPNTIELEGTLKAQGVTYSVKGDIDNNLVYNLSVAQNGYEIAKATLQLTRGNSPIMNILMGEFHADILGQIQISRITEMTADGVVMHITYTNAGQTVELDAGLRMGATQDGYQLYELYIASAGMEYGLRIKYALANALSVIASVYQAAYGNEAEIAGLVLDVTPADTPAHVSGTPLPTEQIEALLTSIIDGIIDMVK